MNVFICGATSTIAIHVARLYAMKKSKLFLVGRKQEKLDAIQKDLLVRGADKVSIFCMDLVDKSKIPELLDLVQKEMSFIDVMLVAQGELGDQKVDESNLDRFAQILENNFVSPGLLLTAFAPLFEKQQGGSLAAITSVAADRGRQSNYHYGSAKAGLSAFLSGLRNRMHAHHVQVTELKLGFVDTAMTTQFKKGFMWAKPESIAKKTVSAIQKKRNTVYLPWFWRWIMLIIKSIPECIFKRMRL